MSIHTISDHFNRQLYNSVAIHPLQSWKWGEARKMMGIEVIRIGEFDGKKLINIYQTTFHRIPHTHLKIGYLPRSMIPSQKTLEFLHEYARKNNIIFIKFEPYVTTTTTFSALQIENCKLKIDESPHPLFPNWTMMLDLTKSEEHILENMHAKTRYNIRLAQKHGVVVKEMTNHQGFEIFSKLYFETCRRQRYFGHTVDYHKTVFETLKNKISHILVAFYKDTPLAAYEVFIFNDVLYYPYGGSSSEYKNVMAPNLLMWETIKLGKKKGCHTFDMWGSLGPNYDNNNPWAGFTRFKQGYGGTFVKLAGSYDLVIFDTFYKVYGFLYKIRNRLLRFQNSIIK